MCVCVMCIRLCFAHNSLAAQRGTDSSTGHVALEGYGLVPTGVLVLLGALVLLCG